MPLSDDAEHVDNVYTELLKLLELSPIHRESLNARGFTDEDIEKYGYKTLPIRRREICNKLEKKELKLKGVPGFWQNALDQWDLAGKSGIVIPVRGVEHNIVALKVRVDNPSNASSKYLLISSNPKKKKDNDSDEQSYKSGTSAALAMHFPLGPVGGRYKFPARIRVTEGEIKADVATMLTDVYTVSIPGISSWRLVVELAKKMKVKEVVIAFDSDKATPQNFEASGDPAYEDKDAPAPPNDFWWTTPHKADYLVGKALGSLYLSLKEHGIKVQIEDWPGEAGKGLDDVLISGETDRIRLMPDDEALAFAREMLQTDDLPDEWVYIIGIKRFVHTRNRTELDKEQFDDRYCHETKNKPSTQALSNAAFPKADMPVYMPAKDMQYMHESIRYFNTWRPTDLIPVADVDVSVMLEHTEYLLPVEQDRQHLLDWLAFCVQNPGKKIHWAMLLQGLPGVGKSYYAEVMRYLLGRHNVSTPSNDTVHEPYTAWQKSAQLIVIEEVMARGRLELMNKLKPMITQPTTMVREMYKPPYEQPNVYNLIMFTNHEDAILLDQHDRRYCVLFSPARPKEHSYYQKLWQWTEDNAGGLLHWFACRDLSAFQPRGHAPMTESKSKVIKESLMPLESWMLQGIEDEAWPFQGDLVTSRHLMDCLPNACQKCSVQAVGRALKAVGAQEVGQVKLSDNSTARIVSVRRHETWKSAERPTLVHEYERWSSAKQPGGNPLLDAQAM